MIVVALTGSAQESSRGMSDADAAALEVALGLDDDVTVATVGPADAERTIREALAAGSRRGLRVDAPAGLSSDGVAGALAPLCAGARWVLCGDTSRDRGTGAVPGFLAAELGIGQALGLIAVDRISGDAATLRLVRRLDGGRREVLVAASPTVISVEGSVARLRRASLPAQLAAQRASIEVRPGPDGPVDRPVAVRPYRPRPRQLTMPGGGADDRIRQLIDAGVTTSRRLETVVLEPAAAAARILATMGGWGYPTGPPS